MPENACSQPLRRIERYDVYSSVINRTFFDVCLTASLGKENDNQLIQYYGLETARFADFNNVK